MTESEQSLEQNFIAHLTKVGYQLVYVRNEHTLKDNLRAEITRLNKDQLADEPLDDDLRRYDLKLRVTQRNADVRRADGVQNAQETARLHEEVAVEHLLFFNEQLAVLRRAQQFAFQFHVLQLIACRVQMINCNCNCVK